MSRVKIILWYTDISPYPGHSLKIEIMGNYKYLGLEMLGHHCNGMYVIQVAFNFTKINQLN